MSNINEFDDFTATAKTEAYISGTWCIFFKLKLTDQLDFKLL